MDKKTLWFFLQKERLVSVSGGFTGQVVLTLNINQGGVTDIKRVVEDRIK